MSTNLERDYSRLRFLIVDDKPVIRTMIHFMLSKLGAREIVQATDGEQALKELHKQGGKFDCIVSDWNMEPISGLELLRTIRAGQATYTAPDVRFIMLTGHADSPVVQTAIDMDVHGYLIKPVSLNKFIKALDSAWARTIEVRPAKYYLAVSGVEVPSHLKDAPVKSSVGIVWNSATPKKVKPEEDPRANGDEAEVLKRSAQDDASALRNKRKCKVPEIPHGAILAQDIHDADGTLLVGSGTRLNPSLLARLQKLTTGSDKELELLIGDR